MRLTPNFTLEEMILSETAVRYGIPNDPPPEIIENLRRTAGVLEEIRALAGGVPIIVTSAYRSAPVNRAVGGSKTSAHIWGLAADINAARVPPIELASLIAASHIRFDQCILEFGRWVHVGLAIGMNQPRREILTAIKDDKGRTVYLKGIV